MPHRTRRLVSPQLSGNALSIASRRSASDRCRYLVVVAMLEWPIRRWTTWMSSPRRTRLGRRCAASGVGGADRSRPPRSRPRGPGCAAPGPIATAEVPVAPGVGEEVTGAWQDGSHLVEVLAKHRLQNVRNRDHPRLAPFPDERYPPSVEVDFLGAQGDHFLEPETCVSQGQEEHPADLPAKSCL